MPTVHFTANLQRHVTTPSRAVAGGTVREALEAVFAETPRLRGYIVDDQDRLRQHVAIFVNGGQVADRLGLSDPLADDAEIWVMQALSGG
jgi:molybdopterin converting factor small subunit